MLKAIRIMYELLCVSFINYPGLLTCLMFCIVAVAYQRLRRRVILSEIEFAVPVWNLVCSPTRNLTARGAHVLIALPTEFCSAVKSSLRN